VGLFICFRVDIFVFFVWAFSLVICVGCFFGLVFVIRVGFAFGCCAGVGYFVGFGFCLAFVRELLFCGFCWVLSRLVVGWNWIVFWVGLAWGIFF